MFFEYISFLLLTDETFLRESEERDNVLEIISQKGNFWLKGKNQQKVENVKSLKLENKCNEYSKKSTVRQSNCVVRHNLCPIIQISLCSYVLGPKVKFIIPNNKLSVFVHGSWGKVRFRIQIVSNLVSLTKLVVWWRSIDHTEIQYYCKDHTVW